MSSSAVAGKPRLRAVSSEKCMLDYSNQKLNYGDLGLGFCFLEKLNESRDRICQVDAVAGFAESKGSVSFRSRQVAMEMQTRGIKDNDIVMICCRSHSEQTLVLLATLAVGAVVAPYHPESSVEELKNFFNAIKPKMVFCDKRVYGQMEIINRESNIPHSCQIIMFDGRFHKMAFEKFLVNKPTNFKSVIIKDTTRRVAFIIPSQTTTGSLKLVNISHCAIAVQLTYAAKILIGSQQILSYFPLYWIPQILLICYSFVSSIVRIIPPAFNEKSACKLIHDLKIDTAILGSYYAELMTNHASLNDYDISCLKVVFVGGTLTTAVEMVRMRKGFVGVKVIQCYGTTEMSGVVCGFFVNEYQEALKKEGSVGKPLPGIKIKIQDTSTGALLKPGSRGVISVRGRTMMLGVTTFGTKGADENPIISLRSTMTVDSYYKNENLTIASIEKGYFNTGDIGVLDEDGYLYIYGRINDFVLMDGRRVLPTETETIILTHPYVQEVVVVGNDREVVACIVTNGDYHLTGNMLEEYLEGRLPPKYKINKFRFVKSIPKTFIGKVKKEHLRQSVIGISIEHSKSAASSDSHIIQ